MTEEVLPLLLHHFIPFSTIPRISLVYKMLDVYFFLDKGLHNPASTSKDVHSHLDVYLVIISIKRMYGHNLTDETSC
jgi:hypothetical protein